MTFGSFCRSDPAAALRGLANGALPSATSCSLSAANVLDGEEHLAPDLEQRRCMSSPASRSRDGGDRADVGGDVLADPSVAAGGGAVSRPSSYTRSMASPSTFSSHR